MPLLFVLGQTHFIKQTKGRFHLTRNVGEQPMHFNVAQDKYANWTLFPPATVPSNRRHAFKPVTLRRLYNHIFAVDFVREDSVTSDDESHA